MNVGKIIFALGGLLGFGSIILILKDENFKLILLGLSLYAGLAGCLYDFLFSQKGDAKKIQKTISPDSPK